MANNKNKINKKINEDNLLLYASGTYKGCIDWKSNIGKDIYFEYGDKQGSVKIIDYDGKKLTIKYNKEEFKINPDSFKKGKLGVLFGNGGITKDDIANQSKTRLGEIKYNKYEVKIEIVEYNTEDDIFVVYNDDIRTKTNTTYREFRKKNRLTTPFDKTICNLGYLGIGNYKASYIDENNNVHPTKEYDAWRSMIRRCYADLKENKSYKGCSVCEEWFNFQNFAKWYDTNYYKVKNERMNVDKDILIKGNKIYSPKTCIIAPNNINCLFTKTDAKRGKYPIGVYFNQNKYIAQCSINELGRQVLIGCFNDPSDAFNAYKEFKENYIKQIAEEYKGEIPKILYDAMNRYEVEITD